jgi:hypothetical protein
MTSTLPLTLGGVMDRPWLFSKCVGAMFMNSYSELKHKLGQIISGIRSLLHIP